MEEKRQVKEERGEIGKMDCGKREQDSRNTQGN